MNSRPTVAERERLLRLARAARLERRPVDLSPIVPGERGERLPLSFAQQRLWFLDQFGGDSRAYHLPRGLRLRGVLHRDALVRALDRIVARHEALRTTFHAVDGEPEQRVAPAEGSRFPLVHHDLTGCADAEAELRRLAAEEAAAPFDLERGPLIRGQLARLADDDHVLLVTLHHIVSDGWSVEVLVRELSALYGAFREGGDDPLPPLPVQYPDYAAWQRRWVSGEMLQRQADYWGETLASAPEVLDLPTDRPRPAKQELAGAVALFELDEALTAGLHALSQRHGTTTFMTLLAGWAAVLGRLSGQAEVVIGTPTANRARPETEGLIGFFVNTLALRVDLGGSPGVAELLERVKARALAAQQHQDIPFEQVVERVQPARSLAHTPLFQTMFTWNVAAEGRLELPGLTLGVSTNVSAVVAKFDLSLDLHESGGRIRGGLTYATALFDAATVERQLGYLRRVLEAMAGGDARPVDRLPLLSGDERQLVVEEWNATDVDVPGASCLHERFEAWAAATPNAVAAVHGCESVTYAELNAAANRLAHHLRALGVGPEARVAVCAERGIGLLAGLLAVLKAGGAYLPVDPAHPVERLRFLLSDGAPVAMLAHPSVMERVGELEIPVVDLSDPSAWSHHPATAVDAGSTGVTADGLAYVIHTSGSTGKPKGVMVAHRGVANLLESMRALVGMEPADRLLSVTTVAFDISVLELFLPLVSGARTVIADSATAADPSLLDAAIAEHGATVVQATPATWRMLVEADARSLGSVRALCGGEALPASLAARLRSRVAALWNVYGPTETTIWSSSHPVPPEAREGSAHWPIGRPVANTRMYVLDAAGEPVPVGVAGELHIGGVGVARGYLERRGLTAERFVPDPFAAEPGGRMYRTGDLARWRGDGTLEFLGRTDFQVKVRGFRIELGEIEARLAQHPAVREAAVLARRDAGGDARLVAYYVGVETDVETGVDALRAQLRETLPEHMVPAAFVRMEAFPLTPNGKLDRGALPAPDGDAYAAREYEAPAGEVETVLAEIWAEVLKTGRIGRHDHFFDLGGHSLLAVRVISRVRQVLSVEVALGDLFVHPVLADFARGLETASRAHLPPIAPADAAERTALSFAQQRLWFLEQLNGAGRAYHIPAGMRLRGDLDGGALARALDRIVARHEALRTTFHADGGEAVQRVAPAEESRFALARHDLAGHPDAEAELVRIAAEEVDAPFDLARGPLIRGRLVRMKEDDHVLLVTMHHIVSDGWSLGVLVDELGALYAAFTRGDGDPLPPLPVQYADYAAWQRRHVSGEMLGHQAAYWKETLAGAPAVLELPADRPRPAKQDPAGAAVALALDEALTAGLHALARRHGTTLFMTLLAGWATVLGRLSGQDDVVIGTPTANRGRTEIEGLIGFFVNTLALRIDLADSPSVAELLGRVKARTLAAQQHQDIPFEQVVEAVQPARSLAHSPLFQVLFTWQNTPRERLELPGLTLGSAGTAEREAARYDLALSLSETEGRVAGVLAYATALFDRETVARWAGHLRQVLEAMAADDRRSVDQLPLLRAAERRRVLEAWNATTADFPREASLHDAFEARAAAEPGATAVVHHSGSLTYGELNERANRLAHWLRARGVGPETRVALCVERSPAMLVAMLAVLKAGGAYVPLDPAYPADRLRDLLEDSAPALVLARGSLAGRFAGTAIPIVTLEDEAAWADRPATDPVRAAAEAPAERLAYVIYTSGSTGRPKGVQAEHRAVVNLVHWYLRETALQAGEAVLVATSYAFDLTQRNLFGPLSAGAELHLAAEPFDPPAILRQVAERGIRVTNLTSTAFHALVDASAGGELAALRLVVLGGEPAQPRRLAEIAGGRPAFLNAYGPTECSGVVSFHRMHAELERYGTGPVPIGHPVANARLYLLDGAGGPVPVGVVGELCVGGVPVARGYLRRPGMTAGRFVPDPFAAVPGARMYRTGDLGRRLPDGSIAFLGRNDFQVKVRGFRIEPGEIEARLRERPGVRDAVVVAREDAPGDARLVAYYVAPAALEAEALRAHLRARLPEYMVPAAFVRLDALPLTPTGKVHRRALPAPGGDAFAARAYEAPVGAVETALAGIWAEVLKVDQVGRHDHFFGLGGHSLLAVRVVARARQALSAEIELGDLFVSPVLADFARGVAAAPRAELPPIEPAGAAERAALSFAQQRLWFLDQMGAAGRAYHIPARLRLHGTLDDGALGRALDRIVARHEALRTTFRTVDGEPEQRVAPAEASRFSLVHHDLAGRADAEAELRRLSREEAAAPFDLERGPLVRGALVRLAADDHVLLVTLHHIVSDGWSMGVLVDELSALYGAFLHGEDDPLPPLAVQYADYAAWQRRWVSGEMLQRQADYWGETLAGAPGVLDLPTDRPRPAMQDMAGATAALELDETLTAGLHALARRQGTTLFATVLAGWAAVLGRLSGQAEVVIGTPTANRARPEIEGLIGFFVNTLALRVDLGGSPGVAELLRRVSERTLAAQQHQDIPFEQVVERVQPARSLSHTPLFQAMLQWQNTPPGALRLPGLTPGEVESGGRTAARFDLTLSLGEVGGRIAGGLTYATALFDAATVERQLGYLRRVLEAMAGGDARPIDRLPLLSGDERRLVVEDWNATDVDVPGASCLHERFEAWTGGPPNAVAAVHGSESVTYAELNAAANRLAHHLRALGVGPEARVAVCAERGIGLLAGLLAVLKAGGAYLPVDPAYPVERLRFLLSDGAPVAMLAHPSVMERVGALEIPVVDLSDPSAWSHHPASAVDAGSTGVTADRLAYVIHTSGSTGKPKGVMVAHRGVANLLESMRALVGMEPADRLLSVTTVAFDISVLELFLPLVSGARTVIADSATTADPSLLDAAIAEHGATVVQATPATWRMLVEADARSLGGVRALCGGEALPVSLAARLRSRVAALWNVYGPTETTIWSSSHPVPPEAREGSAHWPIGRPIANTRMYVLDVAGEPVPAGVAGELYIGGAGVARGYLERRGLTAERFVPDPFAAEPGGRMYRTGDLARWRGDGTLEFLGRTDFQVKVRGFRIELGEIEARLTQHPAVREAAVLARRDAGGDARLVAYYVGVETGVDALRAHLRETLPEHMVPAAFVRMEAFPLTPNGKLDRGALPAPDGDAYAAREYEAPAGEVETALAEIWAEVLKAGRVGRHDHFFDLGGHSLLAVRVISRVRQVLSVEVALGDLFLRPVLADFARGLETASRADLPPIAPADAAERTALSFAQQRLWFLEQLNGAGRAYHIPAGMRLRGDLDGGALARALDRIVARHEALRTTFHAEGGEAVQRVAPAEDSRFALARHDLAGHPDAEAELVRIAAEEADAPFDLARGPLIRGRLVRMKEDDHVLLVTMHHIVSDGWSTGVLVDELGALYGAFRRGEPDPLPSLPVQYADYAVWQRRRVSGEVLQRQAAYWAETLAGAPEVLELPTDRPRPARQDTAGASLPLELDEALTAGLHALARRHGTTLFMNLLAGWAALLARLSGQDDVVIGTPTANRGQAEVERLIGFFVNTLALRIDLGDLPSVAELLGRVKARTLDAQQHQDIPFEQVVDLVRPVRSLAHPPLFQVSFTWGAEGGRAELPGLRLGAAGASAHVTAKADMSLFLVETGGRIHGGITYATALFDRETVERWAGYFRRVLEAMAGGDARPVARLPLLSETERRQVVEGWNATAAPYAAGACVHELFEASAARAPHAPAVVQGSGPTTYAELDARANRLAHHLRAIGVGPEARVALCAERSPALVVGLLAVLKAGGAYLPLDPAAPAERLAMMLEDGAPAVLLAQRALAARFAETGIPVVALDDEAAWADRPATRPDRRSIGLTPDHLAYVIFTSGSTGRPKGVMVPHRGVCNLAAAQGVFGAGPGDRVLQLASLGFDASVFEMVMALASGAALHLPPAGEVLAGEALAELAGRAGITHAVMTPALAASVPEDARLAGLRTLVLAGDVVTEALARRFAGGRRLFNAYGPTEATVWATVHACGAEDVGDPGIGRPIENARAYVLDPAGDPVVLGATGELCIGGVGVARGYLRRPAMTAERFVPDPFAAEPGARLYRTGDLARWRGDGTLEFRGRDDFQVKVRGFRVELGEIERALRETPGVAQAVVVAREEGGDRRIVGYLVVEREVAGDDGEGFVASAARERLREVLPEYMVPAALVVLDALPLTPHGKVDRRALPAPEGEAFAASAFEAPVGDLEAALAEIWADVLGVEQVGRRDHFFELGGHSLLAVQVMSRIWHVLGADAVLGDLFERPVLADFAAGLEAASRGELPPIGPADAAERTALSFAQQRLWFLEQLGAAGKAYHLPTGLRLRGPLDRGALGRALDRVVARHESLRTTFTEVDGQPEQRVAPAGESRFDLREHDLSADPDGEAALRRIAVEEAGAPFDLARGPLIRGRLVRMAADEHVLLVTMHHIVSDGWSMGVLVGEMSALYAAFHRGGGDPLPPLAVQYADYAAWQRRWLGGDVLRRQADYWRETLAGAPGVLELPTDRPRPARQDHAGAFAPLALDEELTAGLKELGARHGTTLFMTLLAGWAAVLARLSGERDVVIGTPTANRGRAEIEGLIGFFVNTLAIRVDLDGSPTAAELLGRVRERTLAAWHHQDIPFEQVVEGVQPVRNLAHHPVFQVGLTMQNAPGGTLALPGLTAGPLGAAARATAKLDLFLSLHHAGGRIVGGVEYATALFDRETVERWAGYLRRVLEAMAGGDARPVARLPLLSETERRQAVEGWNATAAPYAAGACVHELFEASAARAPHAPAVVQGSGLTTYAELDARANRLAHHLRALGVGPEARVALCAERSPALVVGLLAVLKAGGAYLPLDPAAPAERLAMMLEDGAPAVLLAQRSLATRFAETGIPVVALDDEAAWAERSATRPDRRSIGLTPDHLAYVIFTSGSTGRPKGVMVPHRGVCNLAAAQGVFGTGPGDRVLQLASLSFDASVFEMVMALASGAALHLPPAGEVLAGEALAEMAGRAGITHAVMTPALAASVPEDARLAGLRTLVLAGDVVTEALARRFAGGRRLFNAYGPTEATVWATVHACGAEETGDPGIGRPIENARVYVLDAAGDPVPRGATGELCIGGVGVARGYLGRPGLTAERFVPDPFSAEPGARLYRTGDLCRWRSDGTLEFRGRDDFQVKVRGFRVELGEIERALRETPGVAQAVAVVREEGGDRRIVGYLVVEREVAGDDGEGFVASAARERLREVLPEYMVPAALVVLDALPLTPHGKVDRRALPAPEGEAFAAGAFEAPVGEIEAAVAEIWADVLGVEQVGRRDHFFELGGHSLLAVQVMSRVWHVLGADAVLGDLFERPVLADFAAGLAGAPTLALPPIGRAERDGALALSFAQQRLWFLDQLGAAGRAYHLPTRLRLRGPLDRGALGRALDGVVARHESLRTTFPAVDGHPWQRIAPAAESRFPLTIHDLATHPCAEAELRRVAAEEARAPFDLVRGPLVRGRLVRMAEDDHVLLLTLHHVVSDGWSMGILAGEVGALYTAYVRSEPDPLPPLAVQYADYAAWQRRWVEGEVLQRQADYWTRTLSGAPDVLELPADRPRPARQDHAGAYLALELDAGVTAGLKTLSQRHGATLFMTLLAGWAAVLARLSGERDLVIGTPTANRGRAEIEGLIGFFVNTLALRIDLAGSPTVAELLGRVRERALEAQEHPDIPFEQVVERVRPARSLSHSPLFQVMFAWQNAPRAQVELPGLTLAAPPAGEQVTARFDLSLTLQEAGGRIVGGVEYATALYDRETVERYLGYLRRALEGMVADERRPVEWLTLLSSAERARVVEGWNATATAYPADASVHAVFEARAARAPGAVAVVSGEESLTYAELGRRANRLARHLADRGVGPGARVAVLLPRSVELVVAELAVLKAGAAYVPIDPSFPAERIALMAADSGSRVVLCRSGDAVPSLPGVERIDADAVPEGEDGDPRVAVAGEALAYVMYTSGSTGTPKGVMVPHRAITQLVLSGEPALGADDRVALASSPAFDAATMEVWGPLLNGGRVVVVPQAVLLDPRAYGALLQGEGVTRLLITPVLFNPYSEAIAGALAGVRHLLTGGDRADPAAYDRVLRAGGAAVYNCYGPTETTTFSLAHRVEGIAPGTRRVPVGRPRANARAYVLDGAGEPVPVGVAGDLYIGGAGVARGYLDRPALTAERFLPDPFAGAAGARMYRTGDLGRWLADGTLEFAGRGDAQVKVRGFRIEPGEIEARLAEHPAVRQAVVVARGDTPAEKRLVAYYVGEDGLDAPALRAYLAERLPEHMVPAAYVGLGAMPLTPNGKLDRRALPAPGGDAFAARAYEAPVGATEAALAGIWSELLGVERVGRHDNFFELGGHSLQAVTLVERMRRRGLHAAVGTLFTAPTLADLAASADAGPGEVEAPANLIPASPEDADPDDDVEFSL